MDNNLTLGWNGQDQITAWQDAGQPLTDGTRPCSPGTQRGFANGQPALHVHGPEPHGL